MTDQLLIYAAKDLECWTSAAFQGVGAGKPQADETARVLVRTNLRGIDTHGISRVSGYIQKIKSGEVNPAPRPMSSVRDGVLQFDGDGGLGQYVATGAMREAVARAQETSVVTCLLRRSGHLAALGQFTLEAAERGMVAIMCQETPPLMALAGSKTAAIGNNPIAFSIPVAGAAPLVFDMATSVTARGNLLQKKADGCATIPEGWAAGPDGEVTTDTAKALKGFLLPVAAHKGIGLAMLVQVLAGSLTGSITAASAATHGATSSAGNVSAFLLVINPDRLVGKTQFDTHVRQWLDVYRAASGEGCRYPGQRAAECEAQRVESGIPIPPSTLAELRVTGTSIGVPFDLTPLAAVS